MLYKKTMNELAAMLASKETTSREIVTELLNRINKHNPVINAYISYNAEYVLEQADASDKRRAQGKELSRFDGVPVALKDNIAVKGMRLTCASKILSNLVVPYNAFVTDRLLGKGMVLLGKTNMDEFAMGSTSESSYFGITRNPHNTDCVPGGSSGGSAAAVAGGLAPVSLGSDTGGSIRQPASFCGVVGIKPTYGRVSRYGLVAFASSLDQIGTFGRTVDDAADLLAMISGRDERDSTSLEGTVDFTSDKLDGNIKGMKIGIPDEYYKGANPEIKKIVEDMVASLEKQGAVPVKISMKTTEYAIPVYYLIATAEASSNLARFDGVRYGVRSSNITNLDSLYKNSRSEGFGSEVKRRIILGTYALSSGYYDAYYLQALKVRTLIINDFKEAFKQVDAIVTPVTTSTAFRIGEKMNDPLEMYLSDILTISANLAAIPGLSVPVGFDSKKMPVGLQIMGNHFAERTILNLAKAVEKIAGRFDAAL